MNIAEAFSKERSCLLHAAHAFFLLSPLAEIVSGGGNNVVILNLCFE